MKRAVGYLDYQPLLDAFVSLVQETLGDQLASVVLYGSVARRAQEVVELAWKGALKMLGVDHPKVHDVALVFSGGCSKSGERWRAVLGFNPMAGVVEGFRWALLGTTNPPGPLLLVSVLAVIALLVGGLYYFPAHGEDVRRYGVSGMPAVLGSEG